jgi:DHA2 family methylenomycin A resistance protein-like MFS transporter
MTRSLVMTRAEPRRGYALFALCLAFVLVQLDATAVNVALEALRVDLGGTVGDQQWVVDAYTVALAAGMLGAGSAGDRFGPRRIYLLGLLVFAAGSVLCALAGSQPELVVARVVQGGGAAALLPCSLALIVAQFPEPGARARALGVWGGVASFGLAAGPVLGGALVASVGWRAIFLMNLPLCAIAVPLVLRFVVEAGTQRHTRFDWAGLVFGTSALALLVGGLIEFGQPGQRLVLAPALLIGACLTGWAFVVAERRSSEPMVPASLFTRRRFTPGVSAGFLFNFCLYGVLLALSLLLQSVLHQPAFRSGLLIVPLTVAIGVGATCSGRLTARFGSRAPMLAGYTAGGLGAMVIAVGGSLGSLELIVAGAALLGFCSLAMPAMTAAVMAASDRDRPGLASGVLNTARQTGGALGVAVLGTLLHVDNGSRGADSASVVLPMVAAVLGYLVAIGCTVLATRDVRSPG